MARTVTTGGSAFADAITRTFAQWRTLKVEAALIKSRQDKLRDRLMTEVSENGEDDAKGHRHYTFAETVSVGDKTFSGFRREVRKSTVLDEELAEERLKEKGVYEQALVTRVELDQELIYQLYADEKITGDDIDYMFVTTETYALKESA